MMLSLSEAIAHCKEKAEELSEQLDFIVDDETEKACIACMLEHEQLVEWLTELKELREFAKWVRGEVLDNYFEESSGAFAEIACRKLVKLGLVEVKDNVYKRKGGAEMKNTDPIIKAIQENNAKYDERPNIDFSRMSCDLGGGKEE